jgi:hypothetical protein
MDKILGMRDNEAYLLREELELIPEFKALFALNYNKQAGDVDGRRRVRATKELTYIWFMYSHYSPFREYTEAERKAEALELAGLPSTHPTSVELDAAIKKYQRLNESRMIKLIRAAEKAMDNLRGYFETIDFSERNASGMLVNKPSEVIRAISELDAVAEGLEKLARRQKTEQNQFVSARGSQEVGFVMERQKVKIKENANSDPGED